MIPEKVYDILSNLLPMIILFSVVMILVKIVAVIYNKEKIFVYKDIKNIIYIIYCFALFKLVTTTDFVSFSNNFTPFQEIKRYEIYSPLFFRNIVGNIVLFIPFAYIISDMIKERIGKTNLLITSFICLFTSCGIETIQMFIGRSFDIDDIILNFAGSIIGYTLYKLVHFIYKHLPEKFHNEYFKITIFLLVVIIFLTIFILYYEVTK